MTPKRMNTAPRPGDTVPDAELPNHEGKPVRLASLTRPGQLDLSERPGRGPTARDIQSVEDAP